MVDSLTAPNTRVIKFLAVVGVLGGSLAATTPSMAVEGMFRIAPVDAPQKTFDLPGRGCPYYATNSGNNVSLYSHDNTCGSGDQMYYIHDVGGGQHEIRQGGGGGKCVEIDNGGGGTRLGTWDCGGGPNQRWYFDQTSYANSDGLYGQFKIRSVKDGRVIDLSGDNTANGTPIGVYADTGSSAQRWILWGGGGMHPDFEEDFNGSYLNTSTWTAANMGAGKFNNELQSYSPSKVSVSNGRMHIDASYNGGCNGGTGMGCYTSGRVNSKGKRWDRNGMMSARIHYYEGGSGSVKGTWPAFWMLGNNINEDAYSGANTTGNCWPTSGAREIDIWEWVRNNNGASYINNGIVSNGGCGSATHQSVNTSSWNMNDWITVAVKIDGGRVKFYRGGNKTHDIPDSGLANEDFSYMFNLAVGGMLGGSSRDFNGTDDWAALEVDWVTHETW